MPKLKTKFTAEFITKIGKTPVTIGIPLDLATNDEADFDALVSSLSENASESLDAMTSDVTFKFTNQAEIKKAFKAHAKANPPADASA